MPIIGCYALDLHCDAEIGEGVNVNDASPATFAGPRREDAIREAREQGWIVNEARNRAVCPACFGKKGRVREW